jgi:hypothetical protein
VITLSIQPQNFSIPEFRIFITAAGEQSDVRLDGLADVYVDPSDGSVVTVDNSARHVSTANDRVDDRQFPGDYNGYLP